MKSRKNRFSCNEKLQISTYIVVILIIFVRGFVAFGTARFDEFDKRIKISAALIIDNFSKNKFHHSVNKEILDLLTSLAIRVFSN